MRIVMIGAAVAVFSVTQVSADPGVFALKDLSDLCSKSDETSQSSCNLFILGAVQGLSLADGVEFNGERYVEKKIGRRYCVPDNTANAVMRDKVLAMIPMDLKTWPEDANLPAISWVGGTILRAWPCQGSGVVRP